jgi:hypothetical protein
MGECAGDVPPMIDLTAIDNCDGNITVTGVDAITNNPCGVSIVRTWTFTDICGNVSSVSQNIVIQDVTPPVPPAAPADVMEECAGDVPPMIDLTAIDNCDGNITVTGVDAITNNPCGVSIVRTWTFTDICGNVSSVSQNIVIQDVTPPVINCPGDLSFECAGDVPAAFTTLIDFIGRPRSRSCPPSGCRDFPEWRIPLRSRAHWLPRQEPGSEHS